jgi:hypothetical protein
MVRKVHPEAAAAEDARAELLTNERAHEELPTCCLHAMPIGSQTGRHEPWIVAPVELAWWDDLVQGLRPCTTRTSGSLAGRGHFGSARIRGLSSSVASARFTASLGCNSAVFKLCSTAAALGWLEKYHCAFNPCLQPLELYYQEL